MKELRNKDIRDQLKDFPMKAPEGLLDDVKSEMLRRGLSSAPAPSKQKYIAIYRIASVAAMLFILLSISLLWEKEAEIQLESHIISSSFEEVTSPMLEEEEEEQMSTPATPRPTQALAHTQQVTALHTDTLTTEEENTPGETKEKKEEEKKEQEAPKNQQPKIQEKERHTTPANKEQKWEYTPKRRKTSSFSFGAHLSGLVAQANLSSNQMDMNASASPITPPVTAPPAEDPPGEDYVTENDSTSKAINSRALSRSAKDGVRHHLPIRVGLSFRYSNGQRWYIQSGLTYSYLTSDISYTERTKQKLHYIGIPLQIGSQLWESNRLKGYISIGGQAEKLVSGKATAVSSEGYTSVRRIKDTRLLFSLLGSVGAEYALKKDLSLYVEPEIHYYFKNGNRLLTHYNDQPLNINLTIGFRFHWEK